MIVSHKVQKPGDSDIISAMLELAGHPGIAQFRVGTITTGALDTAVAVTFSEAFSDTDYEVFIQPLANLATVVFPSDFTAAGFTFNLSVGVIGTFAYLAVGVP